MTTYYPTNCLRTGKGSSGVVGQNTQLMINRFTDSMPQRYSRLLVVQTPINSVKNLVARISATAATVEEKLIGLKMGSSHHVDEVENISLLIVIVK
ncbi:hypothetical protein TNCV_1798621 [Trichonephila clavipes]|uniref:Uncharacterized protein n=1 Tax=Trichonephila clavipes TaxID=2585209 RepID=A0A8X6VMU6_TRICX|nr:hypothetical protein TNCV_1798621 [Trichonephila clavipes]